MNRPPGNEFFSKNLFPNAISLLTWLLWFVRKQFGSEIRLGLVNRSQGFPTMTGARIRVWEGV